MPTDPTTGLAVPTPLDLAAFKGISVEELDAPASQIEMFLQIAADLLILRTGLKKAPSPDTPLGRITKYGIMDLAYFLGTTTDEWSDMISPFSSEKLGSYAYAKTVSSVSQKRDILDAPLFDEAVKWLTELAADEVSSGGIGFHTENVFPSSYAEYSRQRKYPSVQWTGFGYDPF